MKIPMQMGGSTDVAFTLATGITNFNSRTRIYRDGNIITAYICINTSTAFGSGVNTLITLNDTSLAPSANTYGTGTSSSAVLTLSVTTSGSIAAIVRSGTVGADSAVYGQISWTVGK